MDQMEAKLREQDRKKRHWKTDDAKDTPDKPGDGYSLDDGHEEMDVESEEEEEAEEEEEIKIRRAGMGARKKRAIDFEEEDEG